MAQVIENPVSGERIVVRRSGADTGGELLSFDLFLPAGGHVPSGHVHPAQEERFTIVEGRMRFKIGRRTVLAAPGDTVTVPRGTAHWFGNPGPVTAHALVEVRPAMRMQELFETSKAIGSAGHLPGTRLPRITDLALFLLEFEPEVAVPHVPRALLRAALAPIAWLARRGRRDARGRRTV